MMAFRKAQGSLLSKENWNQEKISENEFNSENLSQKNKTKKMKFFIY